MRLRYSPISCRWFSSRAHALLAWHEEAALGCALVAVYHDLHPTSIPPFLLAQYVATRTYRMPPNEVLRIFRGSIHLGGLRGLHPGPRRGDKASVNKAPVNAPDTSEWHHGCCRPVGKTRVGKKEAYFCVGRREHGIGLPFLGGTGQGGSGCNG